MAFLIPDRITTLNGVTTKIFDLTKHNDNNISLPAKQAGAFMLLVNYTASAAYANITAHLKVAPCTGGVD